MIIHYIDQNTPFFNIELQIIIIILSTNILKLFIQTKRPITTPKVSFNLYAVSVPGSLVILPSTQYMTMHFCILKHIIKLQQQ